MRTRLIPLSTGTSRRRSTQQLARQRTGLSWPFSTTAAVRSMRVAALRRCGQTGRDWITARPLEPLCTSPALIRRLDSSRPTGRKSVEPLTRRCSRQSAPSVALVMAPLLSTCQISAASLSAALMKVVGLTQAVRLDRYRALRTHGIPTVLQRVQLVGTHTPLAVLPPPRAATRTHKRFTGAGQTVRPQC
ncbi:hypothetical protein D3C76_1329130 [compost metagenome]